jgi:DNA replication protein DnaC
MHTNHQELQNNFEKLGLHKICEYFPNYLEAVNHQNVSFTQALLELTNKEIEYRLNQKILRTIEKSRFPSTKRFSQFDFSFQPSIDKREILELEHLGFMETCHNICFLGNSGVGKTHLAVSIGVSACEQGVRTQFIVFHDLVHRLTEAYQKGTFDRVMKRYANVPLLIIDEIGYVPITKEQADWFYQLMSQRYEQRSTVITTNIPFSMWGKMFNNDTASAAILDRLIHHSKVFRITGKSYRLKDYHEEKMNLEEN